MAQEIRYPFQLANAFFKSIEFARRPELPDPLNLVLIVEIRIHDQRFPNRLQIDLRFVTPEDQPMTIAVELISLFDFIEGQPEPDRSIITEFVNERVLHMLWPYMTHLIRDVTIRMGTNPINLQTPHRFNLNLTEEGPQSDAIEQKIF